MIKNNNEKNDSLKNAYQDSKEEIPSDVLGSYTGVPEDEDEEPIQDADDL